MSILQFASLGCWQSASEFSATAGTISYSTGVVHDQGGASLRANPATTGTGYAALQGIAADGTVTAFTLADAYVSFYFRAATLPASGHEPIFAFYSSGGTLKFSVAINSSGNLMALDRTGATAETGSTVLAADTWYKIDVRGGNGETAAYAVRINDAAELSGTAAMAGTDVGRVRLGKTHNISGQTVDFYYNSFVIRDDAFQADGYEIAVGVPTADGSTMQWTGGTGNYTGIDEIPDSTADYVEATGAGDVALFDFAAAATLGVSGTIHGVMGIARLRMITGTASTSLRTRSGTTNSDGSPYATTISTLTRRQMSLVDPDTSTAWTTGGIDDIELGAVEANAVLPRITSLELLVMYTPGAGASPNGAAAYYYSQQ